MALVIYGILVPSFLDAVWWVGGEVVTSALKHRAAPRSQSAVHDGGRPRWVGACRRCIVCMCVRAATALPLAVPRLVPGVPE